MPILLSVSKVTRIKLISSVSKVSSELDEWVALVEKETGQHIGPVALSTTGGLTFREHVAGALAAVRLAAEQPNPHIHVQEIGPPKNHAVKLVVAALLEIFESATGIEPTVYTSEHTEGGYELTRRAKD